MPLACTLGLTACLTYGGIEVTAADAIEVMQDCDLLQQVPINAFGGSRESMMGLVVADSIREKGIKLTRQDTPYKRKAAWLNTCKQFQLAFYDDHQWENLDKFPN